MAAKIADPLGEVRKLLIVDKIKISPQCLVRLPFILIISFNRPGIELEFSYMFNRMFPHTVRISAISEFITLGRVSTTLFQCNQMFSISNLVIVLVILLY